MVWDAVVKSQSDFDANEGGVRRWCEGDGGARRGWQLFDVTVFRFQGVRYQRKTFNKTSGLQATKDLC